jgi:hypothetical protein
MTLVRDVVGLVLSYLCDEGKLTALSVSRSWRSDVEQLTYDSITVRDFLPNSVAVFLCCTLPFIFGNGR